jgi:hypothetical protein
MSDRPMPGNPVVASDPLLHSVLADLNRMEGEVERFKGELILDKQRLFPLLEDGGVDRRLIAYLAGPGGGEITLADAAPIGSMLDAIGSCDELDLMLNSAGGSGEMAEKLIEMCRVHCSGRFRVIVPNFAKSAATIVALGADTIVMGYLSELGPIDPQYPISVGGSEQLVSAQSFLRAYELAQTSVANAIKIGESPAGFLQSLSASTMEPAFLEHCRRGIEFSRDIAQKFLPEYQLQAKFAGQKITSSELAHRAEQAAENLLSKNIRFSHGRLIGAKEARDDVGLNVELLDPTDPTWEGYWELYVRAEVFMQTAPGIGDRPVSKLFFDRDSTLPAY